MRTFLYLAICALLGTARAGSSDPDPIRFSITGKPDDEILPPYERPLFPAPSLSAEPRHTDIVIAAGPIPFRRASSENELIVYLPNFFGFSTWSVSSHAPLEEQPPGTP